MCDPYSIEACKLSVDNLGLQKGTENYGFSGDYGTKGCYAYKSGGYAGVAFYGTGGSEAEMKTQLSSAYRPDGYNCSVRTLGSKHCISFFLSSFEQVLYTLKLKHYF